MATQTRELTARIVTDEPCDTSVVRSTPKKAPLRQRVARKATTALISFFVLFMVSMGAAGGTQPANAIDIIPGDPVGDVLDKMKELFCFGTKEKAPAPVSSNSDKALVGARAPFNPPFTNKSVTAYEEYGFTGLFWSEYRPKNGDDNADGQAGCVTNKFGPFIGNMIANNVFSVTRSISAVTISIFSWATDGDMLDSFSDPLDCVIDGCRGGKGLKTTLFLNYLAPIVMLGALWGAWNGLVKKRATETAQGGLWMVCATAFALIFMANPGLIADKANDFVNKISNTITNSVTSASSSTVGRDDMCFVSGENKGNRMAACSMYKAMMVTPWAAGQFGVPMGVPLESDKAVRIGNRASRDLRVVQIDSQTVSATEIASGAKYEDILEQDGERWMAVHDQVWDGVGKGPDKADRLSWSGDQYGERVNIAFASVIAALCLGLLVVLISFSTVVLAVGMILLIMLAPLFLLIGIHPGFGRGIALKWLELLLGTVVKRIVLSAVLALLVGMYQVILETPMPWFSQIGLIMALGVGAIIFRKPLLETLNVINLGGTRTGMESGMDRAAKRGGSAVAGGMGGAVGAGLAGAGVGGVIGGAAKGSVMGSRSSSPVRAATMGGAAGRRVGSRDANQREQARVAQEKAKAKEAKAIQDRIDRDPFDPDAWRDLEAWNKKNKGHQVVAPVAPSGDTPYPQSAREAEEWAKEGSSREDNDPGSNAGPQGTPPPRPQSNGPQNLCTYCSHESHGTGSCNYGGAAGRNGSPGLPGCRCTGTGSNGGGGGSGPRPQPRSQPTSAPAPNPTPSGGPQPRPQSTTAPVPTPTPSGGTQPRPQPTTAPVSTPTPSGGTQPRPQPTQPVANTQGNPGTPTGLPVQRPGGGTPTPSGTTPGTTQAPARPGQSTPPAPSAPNPTGTTPRPSGGTGNPPRPQG